MKCVKCNNSLETNVQQSLCLTCKKNESNTSETGLQDDENKLQSNISLLETDKYVVKFHIFIPPEFKYDEYKCKFVVMSSYNNWQINQSIPLVSIRKIDKGHIFLGRAEFQKSELLKIENKLEYKYALIYQNERELRAFYECKKLNRILSFLEYKDKTINRYDGIMLPMDKGYEENSWWTNFKNEIKRIITVYGSDDMVNNYKTTIISAMLYEVFDYIDSDSRPLIEINILTKCFKAIFNNLRQTFSDITYRGHGDPIEIIFCNQIIRTCYKNGSKHSSKYFSISLALLIFISKLHRDENRNLHKIDYEHILELIKISNDIELQNALKCLENTSYKDTEIIKHIYYLYKKELKSYKESINILHIIILLQNKNRDLFSENYDLNSCLHENYVDFCTTNFGYIIQACNLRGYLDSFERISPKLITLCVAYFVFNKVKLNKLKFELYQLLLFLQFYVHYYSTARDEYFYQLNHYTINFYLKILNEAIHNYINQFDIKNESCGLIHYLTISILNKYVRILDPWKNDNVLVSVELVKILIFVSNKRWNDLESEDRMIQLIANSFNYFTSIENFELKKWLLEAWDDILKISDLVNEILQIEIKSMIKESFRSKMNFIDFDGLIKICESMNSRDSKYHGYLIDLTFQEILNKITPNIKNDDIMKLFDISSNDKGLIKRLANNIFKAKWPSDDREDKIFLFLIENIPFLKTFFVIDSKYGLDDEYLQLKLVQSRSLITNKVEFLLSGQIQTITLKNINKNKNHFIELCLILKLDLKELLQTNDDETIKIFLQNLIDTRFIEFNSCQEFLKLMGYFNQLLCEIGKDNVEFKFLNNENLKLSNCINEGYLNQMINVLSMDKVIQIHLSSIDRSKYLYDDIKEFGDIPRDKVVLIQKLVQMSSNAILKYFINQNLKHNKKLNICEFLEFIVSNAFNEWYKLATNIVNGTIRLNELNNLIKECKQDWIQELDILMKSQNISRDLMNLRRKQIQIYFKITSISKITNILILIAKEKSLKGSVENLTKMGLTVKKTNYDSKLVKDIDEHTLDLFSKLDNLNDLSKIKCLDAFLENIKFIDWLKKQAKSLKDLKLLAEFASESDNEGSFEVCRIQTLLLVGTAYAPLIYDLNQNSDENDLIEACERVCANLDTNPALADKINTIAQQKSWLEDIKEAKGNTSASSLKQAIQINEKGEYIICLDNANFDEHFKIELQNLIKLEVPVKTDGQISIKKYAFSQITDLQDKLTLVVGEEHQSVIKYYEDILESIIDLTRIFVQLLKSGNILFKNWSLRVYCDREKSTTVKANFGINDENNLKNMVGLRIHEKDTVSSVHKIRDYLKDCYNDWIQHINEKRDEYPLLNYFTIQQLTLLRTKLTFVNQGSSRNDNNIRYFADILYNINPNCNFNLLEKANLYAYDRVKELENDKSRINTQEVELNEMSNIVDDLKLQGFSLDLIREAFRLNSKKDFIQIDEYRDALFNYCIQNEHKPLVAHSQNTYSYESIRLEAVFDLINYDSESLEANLQYVWLTFKQILNKDLSNFLCLDHIGLFLNYLKNESKKPEINRRKPAYLELNVPNIIVCEQNILYSRVLEIYSLCPEQPLPNDDEIMFCSETTTAEDIEIFLKRVFNSQKNEEKIYSIVNVHNLAYDQSIKVIYLYDQLTIGNNFTLVLFCAQEKEDKSILVTSFNRYQKKLSQKVGHKLILRYLGDHFNSMSDNNVEKDGLSCRLIKSDRAGTGKSLYIKRLHEKMLSKNQISKYCCIPVKSKSLDIESIFSKLRVFDTKHPESTRLFHFDISFETLFNVDPFLFQLLCMGVIRSSNGELWRRSNLDLYLIEIMSPKIESKNIYFHSLLHIIPTITCATPIEVLSMLQDGIPTVKDTHASFDDAILKSCCIQRPCQYLSALDLNTNLDTKKFNPDHLLDALTCLKILLRHSEIQNPSWLELTNFSKFLNIQLDDSEKSIFCNLPEDLPGFKTFVIKFMIQMSHDFALPSLVTSDRSSLQIQTNDDINFDIDQIKMRKKWEENPHPYLFFNPDGNTFTFLGFNVNASGQFININSLNREVIFDNLTLSTNLMEAINRNARGILNEDISEMSKYDKINKILQVMGKSWVNQQRNQYDPDPTYELTMDNILKIMAIYMRFRCNIPVIIMGETGCGKTRLIRYLCDLQKNPNKNAKIENMYIVKVHGGLGSNDIINHVYHAIDLAKKNRHLDNEIFTILFFDEANTTEAIGTIKEVMCDQSVNGEPIDFNSLGLKIIAACNPYKKHSQEIINKFKQAGLGFYEGLNDIQDKLGSLPMRELVYRVQPLPAAMLPMIWDFGQLNNDIERLYVSQMVDKYTTNNELSEFKGLLVNLLCLSQRFMREQRDECSFVSLRDIQRVLCVLQWFVNHRVLFTSDDTYILNSIIHSFNACYHVSLQNSQSRQNYIRILVPMMRQVFDIVDENYILNEINRLYELFLNDIDLPDAIARNQALKENVFMIIICIELKIPLFIIGKPGSSKTLAKTLVANKMQGTNRNEKNIFNHLKEAHLITFQCSPLSTSEMIIKTFQYCSKYQLERRSDLDKYVSLVVLDEIGLAEASKSMPLKSLHSLLEDGVYFDQNEEASLPGDIQTNEWRKIGFIGISNWVLDPAKMNRGIFVNRCSPDLNELRDIASGICKNDHSVMTIMDPYLPALANGFVKLCKTSEENHREFYGLRDFYSLIKMIYYEVKLKKGLLDSNFFERSIRRNFGGLPELNPLSLFFNEFSKHNLAVSLDLSQSTSIIELIRQSLDRKSNLEYDNRYVLLIAQNENALDILKHHILHDTDNKDIKIIFGSSFPNDQSYSQICRQIHQIKLCMETGKTVILLNLETLYESLYDALNQFYYRFGDNEKFVDLGLGTQRVKCLVHDNFRLIVVSDKINVYNSNKFPIPLVNRLEKHFLSMELILDDKQLEVVREIQAWLNQICYITKLKIGDIFIGYTEDTLSTLVLKICIDNNFHSDDYYKWCDNKQELIDKTQEYLIQCATFNGIIQIDKLLDFYMNRQAHNSFNEFIERHQEIPNFVQITTHSKLLSKSNVPSFYQIESLLAFDTKQQFEDMLRNFFANNSKAYLVIQCDCGNFYQELINCTRFCIVEQFLKYSCKKPVIFIIQIPKISGGFFNGFQCNEWFCYHIDDLNDDLNFGSIFKYKGKPLSNIFNDNRIRPSLLYILELSIYSICSKIVDLKANCGKTSSQDRITSIRRVETLISLFKKQYFNFKETLFDKITKLQKDKEKLQSENINWLTSKEVFNNIMKYGTLKQSCKIYIEERISELGAGLIAYIDTNLNLDVLVDEKQEWLIDLWLNLFTNDEFLNFNYQKYYALPSNRSKHEFYCINSIENETRLKLPFSWLIKDFIDNLISPRIEELTNKNKLNIDDEVFRTDPRIIFNQLSNVFKESYQYQVLNELLGLNSEEFVYLYIHDFLILNQIFNNHKGFFDVINYRLIHLIRIDFIRDLSKLEALVALHLSFVKAKNEIELLSKFIDKHPILIKIIRTDSLYNLNLCFVAVEYIFNQIINIERDMSVKKWNEWIDMVSSDSFLIESFMKQFNNCNIELMNNFKSIWEKFKIIKMLIDYVCKSQDNHYNWPLRLWSYLKPPVNFKTKSTIESFINFYELICNSFKNSYLNQQGKCSNCKLADVLKSNNNCKCYLCDKCETQFNSTKFCPSCGFAYKDNELKFIQIDEYKTIKNNYIKLRATIDKFLIEIVAFIAFKNNTIPSDDAIEYLVNKVIKQNKLEMSASVKLKLMYLFIKFNCYHFDAYDSLDISHIYITAYEDYLFERSSYNNNFEETFLLLEQLCHSVQVCSTIDRLNNIAKIRFCLTNFAKILINFNPSNNDNLKIVQKLNQFIQMVNSQWLIYFLIKQIYRRTSRNVLISLTLNKELNRILPDYLRTFEITDVPDSYVIFGDTYLEKREKLKVAVSHKKTKDLKLKKGIKNGIYYYLAMFKLSKVSNLIDTEQSEYLFSLLRNRYPQAEDLHRIIENLPQELTNQHKTLSLLMIHILSTILYSEMSLFESFRDLYKNPENNTKMLFPTMPEDEDFSIFTNFSQTYTKEKFKFYACPNGHLYIIVDCTRPSQSARCKECNLPIGQKVGGLAHTLTDGNRAVENLKDKTQSGYCLGEPINRLLKGIRSMNQFETLFIRLILSCTLYICSIKENNNIVYLIPNIEDKCNLNGYFLRHILNDLTLLSNYLQKSIDECILLIHYILYNAQNSLIKNVHNPGWISKESRHEFEVSFCDSYLKNININKVIRDLTFQLQNDSLADNLFNIAYEKVEPIVQQSSIDYLNNSKYWLFKNSISIEHMKFTFLTTKQNNFRILEKFLNDIEQLEAVKNLSKIVKMLNLMFIILNRQIDRQEASKMTMENLIEKMNLSHKSQEILIDGTIAFSIAWKITKSKLKDIFIRMIDIIDFNNPLLDSDNYSIELPIVYYLSSISNEGRYMYSLLYYLSQIQNELLVFICDELNTKEELQKVDIANLSQNDCINFDIDNDLKQIVYLNAIYTQDLNIQYDFSSIESAIIDKIITNKSFIENKELFKFEFCDDISDINRIKKLNENVQQLELENSIKDEINSFYKQPNQITNMLRILRIVFDFVVNSGCKSDMKIMRYAIDVLKMNITDTSDICAKIYDLDMKYLKSVWTSLSLYRAILLTDYGQEPFDRLSNLFKQEIDSELKQNDLYDELVNKISKNKKFIKKQYLKLFINVLYEFINTKLMVNQTSDEFNEESTTNNDSYANFNIVDSLKIVYDENDYLHNVELQIEQFDLEEYKVKHAYFVWKLLIKLYLRKD